MPVTPTLQYQAKAEAIGPLATVTADKWFVQPPGPVRRTLGVALLVAGTFAPVTVPAPATTVTVDMWQGELSNELPQRARARQPGISVVDTLFVPQSAGEKQPLSFAELPPRLATPRLAGITVTDTLFRSISDAEKQPRVYSELPPRVAQPRLAGWFTADAIANPQTSGEKYPRVYADPLPPRLAPPRMAGLVTSDPLLVTVPVRVDAWQPRAQPDIPNRPQPRQPGITITDTVFVPNPSRIAMWEGSVAQPLILTSYSARPINPALITWFSVSWDRSAGGVPVSPPPDTGPRVYGAEAAVLFA